MTISSFRQKPWDAHNSYKQSILAPVAPEYSTGESFLGAAYRTLILNESEALVDLTKIRDLPGLLARAHAGPEKLWDSLLLHRGGLSSPQLGGQLSTNELPQLMPLVPEVARHACVIGKIRRRWDPGTLLLSALASGLAPAEYPEKVSSLQHAISVDPDDDLFARFIEGALKTAFPTTIQPPDVAPVAPAWRSSNGTYLTPAERFARDLETILGRKRELTRRQWTVLLEALLRLGLGMHMMWLCRLNKECWRLTAAVASGLGLPTLAEIDRDCWSGHATDDPLLELGIDGIPAIRTRVRDYSEARLGLNLLLNSLDDCGASWSEKLGVPNGGERHTPSEKLLQFLRHVAMHRHQLSPLLASAGFGDAGLGEAARRLADSRPDLLTGNSGPPRNLSFFLRYSLGQLRPSDSELEAYDQSYLLAKGSRKDRSEWPVRPGPATLILLVHACCRTVGGASTSLEDFRRFLAHYGIHAPSGEIQTGYTGKNLQRLGLVIDSPDAGGGRLLVDPF